MRGDGKQGRLIFLLLVLACAVGMYGCWRLCEHDNKFPFLTRHGAAEWILYPKPPDGMARSAVELSAVFRKSFQLDAVPVSAVLSVRTFKRGVVSINGAPIAAIPGPGAGWKQAAEFEAAKALRAGSNEISVTVFNTNGPPALSLSLIGPGLELNTGADWEVSFVGAAWRPARLASEAVVIGKDGRLFGGETTGQSFRHTLPVLILFAVMATILVAGGRWWLKRSAKGGRPPKLAGLAIGGLIILWGALFWNNAGQLPALMGFDVTAHLDYVDFIRTRHALPLATDGWEMCQPPLYYAISAAIVSPLHSGPYAADVVRNLRIFGMVTAIAQFSLVFLCLRLLFPGGLGRQLFGLMLAALVPEQLYLSHYVTNEAFAALWITAAIYFCLRLIKGEQDSWRLAAATGFCLGAALLTKITALLAIPFIGGAIIGWLWQRRIREPQVWARTLGLVALVCFAVSGWHYFRVWRHFGTPIVNDWDAASGYAWWTDLGYHTTGSFTRFGESLVRPFYSVFHGFPDGIYSTLWGDGLYGGRSALYDRPPWNYELMAAGFLLALLPTVLILAGAVSGLRKFIRNPDPAWFLLLGLPATTLAALVYMNLQLPFYCNVKAFYGLIALLPLCALGAEGWGWLGGRSAFARSCLAVGLGVWALNAYASFWIRGGSAATHNARGYDCFGRGQFDEASRQFAEALRLNPGNTGAKEGLAATLLSQGHFDEARQQAEEVLTKNPEDAAAHLLLAKVLAAQGQRMSAIEHARRAVELSQDLGDGYRQLATYLSQENRDSEALAAGREGLRVMPMSAEMHYMVGIILTRLANYAESAEQLRLACSLKPGWAEAEDELGISLATLGRWVEAANHFEQATQFKPESAEFHDHLAGAWEMQGAEARAIAEYRAALRLAPDDLPTLNHLAWILATHSDEKLRNGAAAVALAEHACELSKNENARFLQTLAAAYAETGQFAAAVATERKALELAQKSGDSAALRQELLGLYLANKPYHR